MRKGNYMATSLCPSATQAGASHSSVLVGLRKDWDDYLQDCLCKIPSAPSTSVIIEEIIESPMDSRALVLKKGQATPTIESFPSLVLTLPTIAESSPASV